MTEGISYLVDLLASEDSQRQGISAREFVSALRVGMQTESERFPQLIEVLETRIRRAYPEWPDDEVRQRALGNIGAYACMADHDFETEMPLRAATGGPRTVAEWYDIPQEYGAAMAAFADYVGVRGPALREWVLDLR